MSGRGEGMLALAVAVGLLATLPATASAAQTFTVNEFGDQSDADVNDGKCDHDLIENGKQCTLRAAIQQANAGAGSRDTIDFSASMTGNTIFAAADYGVNTPMVIDGGDCPGGGLSHAPCVRVDNNGSGVLFSVDETADDVTIKGLSLTGTINGFPAVAVRNGANRFKLRNSWLGLILDQNPDPNDVGVSLEGNDAEIGGTKGKDRNVFAYSDGEHLATTGPSFDPGNRNKVRGNYFGTLPDGTTAAGSPSNAIRVAGEDNVIGASISSAKRTTATCDGGCNVVAGATNGIEVVGMGTTIKGNYVGLDKTGLDAAQNLFGIVVTGDAEGTTVGGATSAERNYVSGAATAIVGQTGNDGTKAVRNFVGLDANGEENAPSTGVFINSNSGAPASVSRNRIDAAIQGLLLDGEGIRAIRNKIGIPKSGTPAGPASCILSQGANHRIGEPGAGNTVGNCGDGITVTPGPFANGGDNNKIQGNHIGTDSSGAVLPIEGSGILFPDQGGAFHPDNNTIGGDSKDAENVISNSGEDAIAILDAAGSGNRIKRNRGKANGDGDMDCDGGPCDLFIDLIGDFGFGNSSGPNDQVDAPELDNCEPGDATRTHLQSEGGGARPNATIYIFRTSAAADLSPNRINAFVKQVTADGGGGWEANFSQIPSGQRLTALQIDPSGNASELAEAVDPVAAPGSC